MSTTDNFGMFCTSYNIFAIAISWFTCDDTYLQDINALFIYHLHSSITFPAKVSTDN